MTNSDRSAVFTLLAPAWGGGRERGTTGAKLLGASPNPLNRRTDIDLAMERTGHARLSVYDASGRLVRTLLDADLPADVQAVVEGTGAGSLR